MIIRLISICCLLIGSYWPLMGQTQECGTPLTQAQINYMDATRSIRDAVDLNNFDQLNIPLVAHVIRRSDGTGGLSTANLNIAMGQMNTAFSQLDVQFDLCTVNYIDDDYYHDNNLNYSTSYGSDEYNLAIPNRVDDKVNVFFLPNIIYCGWSSFPSYEQAYGKDWTIMNNSCATNGSTFAHELGHYFNLYHTHQGPSSGIGITASELVNGSNCGPGVGDELCDTPADPRLSSSCVTTSCIYTCQYTDSNGDLYVPDPTNIMSYSQKVCRTFFSPQQRSRMLQSYTVDRNNLAVSCSNCPTDLTLNGTINNNQLFEAANSITSTQTITPTADVAYNAGNLITLSTGFIAQNGTTFHAKLEGCSSNVNGGASNARITADGSENSISRQLVAVDQLKTDTEASLSSKLTVAPNPFQNYTIIEYTVEADGPVILSLLSASGKELAVLKNEEAAAGTYQLEFDGSEFTSGVYYLMLQNQSDRITQKLLIVK